MKNSNDTNLQHNVQAELEWDPSIDASRIGVAAQDGVVTLTGTVPSFADKMIAERVTKRVYGVKAVANDIEVHIPNTSARTDADIAAAALTALLWDARVPEERLQVTVRSGRVILDGTVDWGYQREAAEEVVRNLTSVKAVANQIKITIRVKEKDVEHKIKAAFHRSAEVDARRVNVEARDGKVTLSGNVRTWAEYQEAEHAAWAAPGVAEVENLIHVTP
jgi:osmotically-inducible protein OsmY